PALLERVGQRVDLLLVVDVHLQDLRCRLHPAGTFLGEAHGPPEAGEHDVGALALRLVGDRKGDAGGGEDTGDQDLLALEYARHGGPILSEPPPTDLPGQQILAALLEFLAVDLTAGKALLQGDERAVVPDLLNDRR